MPPVNRQREQGRNRRAPGMGQPPAGGGMPPNGGFVPPPNIGGPVMSPTMPGMPGPVNKPQVDPMPGNIDMAKMPSPTGPVTTGPSNFYPRQPEWGGNLRDKLAGPGGLLPTPGPTGPGGFMPPGMPSMPPNMDMTTGPATAGPMPGRMPEGPVMNGRQPEWGPRLANAARGFRGGF